MKFIELRQALGNFAIFTLLDIRKIESGFDRRRLNEWQDKGYIRKVIRGYYIFSGPAPDENALFLIANRIYSPSYVSFESALRYHGLIPEGVFSVTSAATRRTYSFRTKIASFTYRKIKPGLFFGYEIVTGGGKNFKIASAEKAVLDFLYINPSIKSRDDLASLRINKEAFLDKADTGRFLRYLGRFSQKRLRRRAELFLEFMKK